MDHQGYNEEISNNKIEEEISQQNITFPDDNDLGKYDRPKLGENLDPSQLWDEIGFHKPLGGFWYNIFFTLVLMLLSIILMGKMMSFFYPYPESYGYKNVAFNIYSLIFIVFDIGTAAVMGRYLPEANIKDPKLMLHYIQYFIWYQMITGLIQVTIISVYALFYVPESELAYTVWIMLIVGTTQYPGFLGVFANVMDSLQYYNKAVLVRFLGGTLMQDFTQFLFVYLGKLYGQAHPEIGVILGIAIGAAIGLYIDDFFATLLSAYFFSKIMKEYGISPGMCFHVDFTWEEIKPMLYYGIKTSTPSLITGAFNLFNLTLWLTYAPQYTTITILAFIGGSIADIMTWFGGVNITPLVSESYMNQKHKLTQYYLGQAIRFSTFIHFFFIPIIITLYFIMPVAWVALGMLNYIGGTVFIIPRLLHLFVDKYNIYPGQVLYGANKPNLNVLLGILSSIMSGIMTYTYLVLLKIPKNYGITGMAWTMEIGHFVYAIPFSIISYVYIHKKLFPLKMPGKQMIVGMVLPGIIMTIVDLLIEKYIFYPIYYSRGFYPAMIIGLILIAASIIFGYIPLTALFGGWDPTNIEEFRKAAIMSGPSKFIVMPIYRIVAAFSEKSPFQKKFAPKMEDIEKEAYELYIMKVTKRDELKEELKHEVKA